MEESLSSSINNFGIGDEGKLLTYCVVIFSSEPLGDSSSYATWYLIYSDAKLLSDWSYGKWYDPLLLESICKVSKLIIIYFIYYQIILHSCYNSWAIIN